MCGCVKRGNCPLAFSLRIYIHNRLSRRFSGEHQGPGPMARHKRGQETRQKLIDVAAKIIAEHGVKAFTLDRVSREANTSKGGLLYHFPSKEALLQAMIDDGLARYTECMMAHVASEPEGPGRMTRAYLKASFELVGFHSLAQGVFAAAALEPQMIVPIRKANQEWYDLVANDGLPKGRAWLVCCVADGLWNGLTFGTLPDDPEVIEAMYQEALALTRP